MSVTLHRDDLPAGLEFGPSLAVDTETMGLDPSRDRLCLVQLSGGDGTAHLVQVTGGADAPNLRRLLEAPDRLKIFHFARFDVAMLRRHLGVTCAPLYCTKIASKLARTYTDRHGLKDLCRELLGLELDKGEQSSDWGADQLSESQRRYAARDVLHLHALRDRLETMLAREGRAALAHAAMGFVTTRAELDLAGWPHVDVFAH